MRRLLVCTTIAASLIVTGCDQKPEKKDDHISISTEGGKITVRSKDGKSQLELTANGQSANQKLPGFVPLFPGATIRSTMLGSGEDASGGGVIYSVSAPPEDVVAFYRKKAKEAGMEESMTAQGGGAHVLVATAKDSKRGYHVSATQAGGETQVSVFWSTGE